MRWSFFHCCSCDGDMALSQGSKNKQKRRVVILGLGDLGTRLAQTIAERGLATHLKLVSRGEVAAEWAQLLRLGTDCRVSSERADGLDQAGITKVLANFEPDLIIQCASLLSPFALLESGAPAAVGIVKAGFALQIAAHLPITATLMRAHANLAMACPAINCSFPDVSHPILWRLGLAPTAGIGNVAMIARYLEEALGQRGKGRLRIIAHHAHVTPFLTGTHAGSALPLPIAEENGERLRDEDLVTSSDLKAGRHFNYLTAVTAIPLVTALLDEDIPISTHAPGVLGLPGGYPISVRRKGIELDLPAGISKHEAAEFNNLCARADGVERIESDGTLVYTEDARRMAKPFCAELAEPLSPQNWESRLKVLRSFYKDCLRTAQRR
jgi:hypothetical protein